MNGCRKPHRLVYRSPNGDSLILELWIEVEEDGRIVGSQGVPPPTIELWNYHDGYVEFRYTTSVDS